MSDALTLPMKWITAARRGILSEPQKHLLYDPVTGRLLLSASGHLVNEWLGSKVYELVFASASQDAGGMKAASVNETPLEADYDAAWADLPASSAGGTVVDLGYTWAWTVGGPVTWSHTVSAYGGDAWADTSDLGGTPPTRARLRVEVENHAENNWAGRVTLQVRYRTDASFDADLATALTEGTLAGTITIDSTDGMQRVEFELPPGDIDPNGLFHITALPDCADNPGFPGSDQWYKRSLSVSGKLMLGGTEPWMDPSWVNKEWA